MSEARSSQADLLIVNSIGPGFTLATSRAPQGLGGSELEIVQIAHAIARRGYKVIVANGVTSESIEEGVRYIPLAQATGMQVESLWIERFSPPPNGVRTRRIVVRATDIDWNPYSEHRRALESGAAAVLLNTKWQADSGFDYAREKIIIPPALEYDTGGPVEKVSGRFVFASAPMKGLDLSLEMWRKLVRKHKLEGKVHLQVVVPGYSDMYGDKARALTDEDKAVGISFGGMISLVEWRRLIASAEGLFFVSQMNETFGCVAAFAEHYGTRPHILCRANIAGFAESLVSQKYVTQDEKVFERLFVESIGQAPEKHATRDLSPDTLAPLWLAALKLERSVGVKPPEVASTKSAEETELPEEDLPANKVPLGPEFGTYLSAMRAALAVGGSEFGLGLMLMSLTASTQAQRVVEIGRYRGFSTLSLAAGLALADAGWQEPEFAKQRPDVDYKKFLAPKHRVVISIERHPNPAADVAIKEAGLERYVEKIDLASDEVDLTSLGVIDVLLIDGNHDLDYVRRDVARFVPRVRPGGYFVLHDYFGWYDLKTGANGSRVKTVIDEALVGFERVLIDTGFASLVIFRKNIELPPQPERVAPRPDGRPTVGLLLIAKGDEAATIIARAIVSAQKIVDAVTVVSDGGPKTVEVCQALGADVYLKKSPAIDWERGIGVITGARNEALAIAQRKTDYILMLDPDDYYEGELPTQLTADVYEVFIEDSGIRYPRVQLFKSSKGYTYTGIVHEQLEIPPGSTIARADSLRYIRSHGGHQDRLHPSIKYGVHARWLEKWLIDHPDDTRAQFYLGQSYRDGLQFDKAIAAYEKRITMGGWDEERGFAAAQIARILRDTGKDPTAAFLRAYEMRPTRAEPLCELATWLRDEKQKRFALAVVVARMAASLPMPANDSLFLEPSVYKWRALEELAIALYWSGDKRAAKQCYEQLQSRVPPEMQEHTRRMLAMVDREVGG
jgi:tetratricopeptide (TPR) repeat protein